MCSSSVSWKTTISTVTGNDKMTDHGFVLLRLRTFAAEDCTPRSFQILVLIGLGKYVHAILVVHLRRLKNRLDDRFVGEDNIVDERCMPGGHVA